MDANTDDGSLPSSDGVVDEISLEDSGRTSLSLGESSVIDDSVVLNQSESSKSESDAFQASAQYTINTTNATSPIDLNESITIIDSPNGASSNSNNNNNNDNNNNNSDNNNNSEDNRVYIDSNDPTIIDLSRGDNQDVVFGQYGNHGNIPPHVWSRRLDKQFKALKEFKVGIAEGIRLLGLGYRMYKYTNREKGAGRIPVIDPFGTQKATPTTGVPIGGIGAGTIGRGWRGDFNKWQLFSGTPKSRVVEADAFSAFIEFEDPVSSATSPRLTRKANTVTSVLTPNSNPNPNLRTWKWKVNGDKTTYHALYPRSWTVYEEPHPDIRMECRQITPIIPNNYKESSYPVGVFVWKITNNGKTKANVSIMFTFQNGTGGFSDQDGGHVNKLFETTRYDERVTGVAMEHKRVHPIRKENSTAKGFEDNLNESATISASSTRKSKSSSAIDSNDPTIRNYTDPATFAIGVKQTRGVEVSYNTKWASNSKASATALWDEFSNNGVLKNITDDKPSQKGQTIASAVAAKVTLAPGETKEVAFALAWDIPIVRFTSGEAYYKRYTKFYGTQGDAAEDIITDALHSYPKWEKHISDWQQPVLDDPDLPDFYKHALFNELYYIADGGTVWIDGHVSGKNFYSADVFGPLASDENSIGHFAYLEGQEYLMLNTYDVHFYASFALVMNWPLLELSLQRDIAMATLSQDSSPWEIFYSGKVVERKVKGIVPHDVGNPGEDPWNKVNSYCIQDISRWKDLPSKLVLQLYRDYVATGNEQFLRDTWPVVEQVITLAATFDSDQDGVVDNEGFPDQTYDTWSATGCSAYSGGLWIAALSAASRMASLVGQSSIAQQYNEMYEKGKASYEAKLWNGKYYKYDCSANYHHDSIMADQMAGQWYARACGLPPIVPPANARSALKTVFDFNVKKFGTGDMGAVNGMKPNGQVDTMCMQSVEVWTGTTFAVAAAMVQEGLKGEGFETARGVVHTSYEKLGYMFQTPEAWDVNGGYRAAAYMRPLSIWAIQWALENRNREESN